MFLSTVIPATMLDVNRNMGQSPYRFSVPYNFVRGKDITININPACGGYSLSSAALPQYALMSNSNGGSFNRRNIVIPVDVTSYTTTMTVINRFYHTTTFAIYHYTLEVTCDTVLNTITFTPLTTTLAAGTSNPVYNAEFTSATLLTITTNL